VTKVGSAPWARELVRSAFEAEASRLSLDLAIGKEARCAEITAEMGPSQPRVTITMPWHVEMPPERRTTDASLPAGPTCNVHATAFVRRTLLPYARLLARDRQLAEAGADPLPFSRLGSSSPDQRLHNPRPAWAYAVSPIVQARLRADGLSGEEIVRTGLKNSAMRVHSQVDGRDYEMPLERLQSQRMGLGYGVRVHEDGNGVRIETACAVPETVRMGVRRLKNGPLSAVISHPLLDPLNLVISGFDRRGHVVVVRPDDVTVDDVPANLGRPWISII